MIVWLLVLLLLVTLVYVIYRDNLKHHEIKQDKEDEILWQ